MSTEYSGQAVTLLSPQDFNERCCGLVSKWVGKCVVKYSAVEMIMPQWIYECYIVIEAIEVDKLNEGNVSSSS